MSETDQQHPPYLQRTSEKIERYHLKFFGHPMSPVMKQFISNFSFSFGVGLVTAGLLFVANVSAGRLLGPVGYGEYNYFFSLAAASTFFFLLGNNTSGIRFVSDQTHQERRGSIASAAIFLVLLQTIVLLVLLYFLRDWLSRILDLNGTLISLVFFFGMIFSFRELLDSFLRAFGFFKTESLMKLSDAFLVVLTFFSLHFFLRDTFAYVHYVASFLVGAGAFLFLSVYFLRRHLSLFSWRDIVLLFQYNKFLIIAGLSGILISSEKVFIGKYIGTVELGVYSAYYASSQAVLSALAITFMNIFWPVVIKNKASLRPVIEKLEVVFYRYFILWWGLIALGSSFILLFFGKQYPFQFTLIVLFSVASLLNIVFFLFLSILNIDHIGVATAINIVLYGSLIGSIIILKSIPFYLISQILLYGLAIFYVRGIILRSLSVEFLGSSKTNP